MICSSLNFESEPHSYYLHSNLRNDVAALVFHHQYFEINLSAMPADEKVPMYAMCISTYLETANFSGVILLCFHMLICK